VHRLRCTVHLDVHQAVSRIRCSLASVSDGYTPRASRHAPRNSMARVLTSSCGTVMASAGVTVGTTASAASPMCPAKTCRRSFCERPPWCLVGSERHTSSRIVVPGLVVPGRPTKTGLPACAQTRESRPKPTPTPVLRHSERAQRRFSHPYQWCARCCVNGVPGVR